MTRQPSGTTANQDQHTIEAIHDYIDGLGLQIGPDLARDDNVQVGDLLFEGGFNGPTLIEVQGFHDSPDHPIVGRTVIPKPFYGGFVIRNGAAVKLSRVDDNS